MNPHAPSRYERIQGVAAGKGNPVEIDGAELLPREDLVATWAWVYDWGPGASVFGARMLAVAILAATFGDEFAADHWERFVDEVIAELPERAFLLTRDRVVLWRRSFEPDDFERAERTAEVIA